jgi:chromosome segregation and condensation protein ScpB
LPEEGGPDNSGARSENIASAADAGDEDEVEFSLEDLGAAYAKAMAESGLLPAAGEGISEQATGRLSSEADRGGEGSEANELTVPATGGDADEDAEPVTPLAIVEAALFVGHPENVPLTAAQIAATMRGVSAAEVETMVDQLNAIYQQEGHAFEIVRRDGGGLWMGIREGLRPVRSAFYGKVRETRLNQAAIDVLALVAYQPGSTAKQISEQRGKDSSAVVNQLVRRELLEVRRESDGQGKGVAHYHPTDRLLNLLGLRELSDLPLVDEADISPSRG